MRVYVAGKTQDLATVKQVQGLVRHTGHFITHDWVAIVENEGGDVTEVAIPPTTRTQYANSDMEGVRKCDLLIAVGHPKISGTLWECGAAAVLRKHIWLVFWERYGRISVFEDLSVVERVTPQEMGERLWRATLANSAFNMKDDLPESAASYMGQLRAQ